MKDIKIESNVPIPSASGRGTVAILKKLQIGDSFICSHLRQSNVHTSAKWVGIKIVTRTIDGTLRVWRIA